MKFGERHATVTCAFDIIQLEVGLGQNFVEILVCPETKKAALLDPALEVDRILEKVQERGLSVSHILLTHTHEDHIAGLDEAYAATKAAIYCHPVEIEIVAALGCPAIAIQDGQILEVAKCSIEAIWAPGHTAGCVCWYEAATPAVFTGDVLFVGSCGGVNYPGSDPRAMLDTLQRKLGSLPEATRLYPGHDYGKTPTSTLGWEFAHNPALLADTLESLCAYKRVKLN